MGLKQFAVHDEAVSFLIQVSYFVTVATKQFIHARTIICLVISTEHRSSKQMKVLFIYCIFKAEVSFTSL